MNFIMTSSKEIKYHLIYIARKYSSWKDIQIINGMKAEIEDLMNRVTRNQVSEDQASALGISGRTVDSTVSKAYGIPKGIYIGEVYEESAAEKAGLKTGIIGIF